VDCRAAGDSEFLDLTDTFKKSGVCVQQVYCACAVLSQQHDAANGATQHAVEA
jgi:hypothetical protein